MTTVTVGIKAEPNQASVFFLFIFGYDRLCCGFVSVSLSDLTSDWKHIRMSLLGCNSLRSKTFSYQTAQHKPWEIYHDTHINLSSHRKRNGKLPKPGVFPTVPFPVGVNRNFVLRKKKKIFHSRSWNRNSQVLRMFSSTAAPRTQR